VNKGLAGSLLGLCYGILEDICSFHPNLRKDIERDKTRLETLVSNHSERVFTLFLPALGKIFDQSLESGVLVFSGEPLSRSINRRTSIPRLFQGIWKLFFDINGCLKQDISGDDVRLMRTLLYAFKKYRLQCTPSATFKAVEEYYDVDRALPPPSQEWDGDGSNLDSVRNRSLLDRLPPYQAIFRECKPSPDGARLLSITQALGDRISSMLGEFNPRDARFRHGPGAVSDLQTGRAFKYAFPKWGSRLQHVFPGVEFALANSRTQLDNDTFDSGGFLLEEGSSRLIAVPKTQKGPRLIAAEPTCNQWCQQSVRSFLTESIRSTYISKSIDFRRQDLSGRMAVAASVSKTLATVDLSSASDRLSCWLIERLFRANSSLLSAFIACRTPYITNDIDAKSPKLYKLRKFASMGSALTFPVQSLVFYILCLSAGVITRGLTEKQLTEGNLSKIGRQVRVYGDDLIVPVLWMPVLEELFELLYLKINRSKTFSKGNFRESCGTDAFKGVNVSPGQVLQVFDESELGTLQGVVDCANNLFQKGFFRTADRLLSPIHPGLRKLIPYVDLGSNAFGLKTSSGFHTQSRKRWNHDLHYWEYQTLRFSPKRTSTLRHEGLPNLLQYFTEDPSSSDLDHWESGVFDKPTTVVSRGWGRLPV
jgi:hypothetical protein